MPAPLLLHFSFCHNMSHFGSQIVNAPARNGQRSFLHVATSGPQCNTSSFVTLLLWLLLQTCRHGSGTRRSGRPPVAGETNTSSHRSVRNPISLPPPLLRQGISIEPCLIVQAFPLHPLPSCRRWQHRTYVLRPSSTNHQGGPCGSQGPNRPFCPRSPSFQSWAIHPFTIQCTDTWLSFTPSPPHPPTDLTAFFQARPSTTSRPQLRNLQLDGRPRDMQHMQAAHRMTWHGIALHRIALHDIAHRR